MTKYSAFGTALNVGTGAKQVETATAAGTITVSGNISVTVTAANLTGSPVVLAVPVVNGDTAAVVAGKVRDFLISNSTAAAIAGMFDISGATTAIILTRKIPMANDATLNIALATGTATGLTAAATSANTTAGETLAAIAQVTNITGATLAADTIDVTTHDSTAAFEEVVAGILRTGEVSLDIVYDPGLAGHGNTSGLLYKLNNKVLCGFSIVFPGAVTWAFAAYVTGFEPSAPHDGALTAVVKLKLTGAPILA